MDINTKKLKKNAFRVSKVRGLTASRVRVPGGCCIIISKRTDSVSDTCTDISGS